MIAKTLLALALSIAAVQAWIVDLEQSLTPTTSRQLRNQFVNFLDFNKRSFDRRPTFGPRCNNNLDHRTYDGRCNNVLNSNSGATKTKFARKTTPMFVDIKTLPNARTVSNKICMESKPIANKRGLSELVTFFGQFIDHTVTETENTKVAWPIEIPADDPVFTNGGTIPFFRTHQEGFGVLAAPVNGLSSYVDAASVYGPREEDAKALRMFKGGLLKTSAGNNLPKSGSGFFQAGDSRANENPLLTAMHTLWMREHNRVCEEISTVFPALNDEQLYQLARSIVSAEVQAVTFYEFVPTMIGKKLPTYPGYRTWKRAEITAEFSTVAFRVGHTLVNKHVTSISPSGAKTQRLLRDAFFRPDVYTSVGIDAFFRGMLKTKAAEIDAQITDEVRNFLVSDDKSRTLQLDLAALNVQRGRDHGMPSYNTVRSAFRLPPKFRFSDITSNVDMQRRLQDTYGTVSRVDPWIGGIVEDHKSGSLGETFARIWEDQFVALRDGDRFYFEARNAFTADEIAKIPTLFGLLGDRSAIGKVMKNVIVRNTGISASELKNPFFAS